MTEIQGMRIGLIGLGFMGKPMARNLARAGALMIVHNRSRISVDELASEGMTAATSPKEVAETADIIITLLICIDKLVLFRW